MENIKWYVNVVLIFIFVTSLAEHLFHTLFGNGKRRRPGFNPGMGKASAEGNGNPLQYFCLKNPMDREAWLATVNRVTQSWAQLSNWVCTHKKMVLPLLSQEKELFYSQLLILNSLMHGIDILCSLLLISYISNLFSLFFFLKYIL